MSGRGKKFLALGVAVVLCLAAAAQMGSLFHWKVTCTPAAFAESSRRLSNPDRGFYYIYGYRITDEPVDYATDLRDRTREDDATRLGMMQINLREYRTGAISEEVYISNPTEIGTIYKKAELEAIYDVCKERGLYLFLDGARLGYGLTCRENDLTLADVAALTDVFYIGGTKVGALFGEAVVITNEELKRDFRYNMKQRGGMLAKGRLLGIQFLTLFEENRYFEISAHASRLAEKIHDELKDMGVKFYVDSPSNQQFVILPDAVLEKLKDDFAFEYQARVDDAHSAVRICTCWATKEENVEALLAALRGLLR